MEANKQEDVDLIFVLKSIKNGLFNIYKAFINLVTFSLRKYKQLSLFIIVSVSLALGLFSIRKPVYISEMCIAHTRFDNDYCYEMIYNLDSYIHESTNNEKLAEQLSIDKKYTKEVRKITYRSLNKNIAMRYADSVNVVLPFKVEVEVYDNSVLGELQKGILNYLENNEYASKLKAIERQSLLQIEARLDKEIENLDSLKYVLSKSLIPQSTGNGIILGEPINPVFVYDIAMRQYEKKVKVQEKLLLNDSFSIMVGFAQNKDCGKGRIYYIATGILIGYILGMLFLLRKKIFLRE